MRRRPIAVIAPPRGLSGRLSATLDAMVGASPLALELVVPRGPFEPSLGLPPYGHAPRVAPWPSGPAIAARLTAHWLVGPRARRPELFVGVGDTCASAAAILAGAFGERSVGWWGAGLGAATPRLDAVLAVDEVWAADSTTARGISALGRAAALVPTNPGKLRPPPGFPPEDLVILPELGREPDRWVLDAVERFSTGASVRFFDPSRASSEKFGEALARARVVLALEPDAVAAELLEALELERPVVVPTHAPPPWFETGLGGRFVFGRAESLADALAQAWTETGRRRDRSRAGDVAAAERAGIAAAQRVALARALSRRRIDADLVSGQA